MQGVISLMCVLLLSRNEGRRMATENRGRRNFGATIASVNSIS